MANFEDKCPECGKKVISTNPSRVTFCGKVCETNHKWRIGAFEQHSGEIWSAERTREI